ncbi:hypothetical protein MMC26_001142 [Xylographa opegraphella]|nr:hypothetical protein [Xylographa opegraphella]
MSSAKGSVVWNSAATWQATFTVNGVKVIYSASMSKAMSKFDVNMATVTYKDADNDFTGVTNWHGLIGDKTINIKLDNGVVITGSLNSAIADANNVNGSGSWTSKAVNDGK